MSIKTRKAGVKALTVHDLMVDPKDATHVLGDVDLCWSRMGIAALLDTIGELTSAMLDTMKDDP